MDLVLRTGTLNLYRPEILLILGAEKFLQILPQQPKVGNSRPASHGIIKEHQKKKKSCMGLTKWACTFLNGCRPSLDSDREQIIQLGLLCERVFHDFCSQISWSGTAAWNHSKVTLHNGGRPTENKTVNVCLECNHNMSPVAIAIPTDSKACFSHILLAGGSLRCYSYSVPTGHVQTKRRIPFDQNVFLDVFIGPLF